MKIINVKNVKMKIVCIMVHVMIMLEKYYKIVLIKIILLQILIHNVKQFRIQNAHNVVQIHMRQENYKIQINVVVNQMNFIIMMKLLNLVNKCYHNVKILIMIQIYVQNVMNHIIQQEHIVVEMINIMIK